MSAALERWRREALSQEGPLLAAHARSGLAGPATSVALRALATGASLLEPEARQLGIALQWWVHDSLAEAPAEGRRQARAPLSQRAFPALNIHLWLPAARAAG